MSTRPIQCRILQRRITAILLIGWLITSFSLLETAAVASVQEDIEDHGLYYQELAERYRSQSLKQWVESRGSKPSIQSGQADPVSVPVKLIRLSPNSDPKNQDTWTANDFYRSLHESRGCQVQSDGKIIHFIWRLGGRCGKYYPYRDGQQSTPESNTVSINQLKRLDRLLSLLPDDGEKVNPKEPVLVVQVPEMDRCRVWLYSMSKLPPPVYEILNLLQPDFQPKVRTFVPEGEYRVAHELKQDSIVLLPDGKRLLFSTPTSIKIWDLANHSCAREFSHSTGHAQQLRISPNGKLALVHDSRDGRVFDTDSLQWVEDPIRARSVQVFGLMWALSFTPDGKHLLPICENDLVRAPTFTSDGERVLIKREVSRHVGKLAWDTTKWKTTALPPELPASMNSYWPVPSTSFVIYVNADSRLAFWDTQRKCDVALLDTLTHHPYVSVSNDKTMVAIDGEAIDPSADAKTRWPYRFLRIYNLMTGEVIRDFGRLHHPGTNHRSIVWSPDDRFVVTTTERDGDDGGTVARAISIATGRVCGDFRSPNSDVTSSAQIANLFLLENGTLLAACSTGVIRFWSTKEKFKEFAEYEDALQNLRSR